VDARLAAYNAAMGRMAQSYPDDYEVQVYYALTLQASAQKSDLTYANQIKSAALLEKLFEQNPQHSGRYALPHHAYDFAPLGRKGVRRRGAMLALRGRAARGGTCRRTSTPWSGFGRIHRLERIRPLEIQPDYYHASDFPYAHLQLAQDAKANAMIRKSLATADRGDRPIQTSSISPPRRYAGALCPGTGGWASAAGCR